VQETVGGTTTELYYSDAWQVLEERVGGQTTVQYVWSPVYVDALVLRGRDSDGDGTLDERLWVVQDANYNVTVLFDNAGHVVERYVYDPFGQATVLDASWNVLAASAFAWHYLHQGGRFDATSGLYHFRNRDYSPTLGRWTSLDPLRYAAGDVNLYRVVFNAPTVYTDPSGLQFHGTAGTMSPESHRQLAEMFERLGKAARQERARIQSNIAAFREACKANNIDPKIGESILDACLTTSKPRSINPCKKWTEKVNAKLPARDGRDIVKGTERPGPGGKGTIGLQVSTWAWTFTPCPDNLWCIFVDGHFGIRVKFPDGQVFYFDDGDWGTIFTPADNKIPPYVR